MLITFSLHYGLGLAELEVVFFRGRVLRLRSGKEYVHIYVYRKFGGEKLAKYVGREVQGFLVVESESP